MPETLPKIATNWFAGREISTATGILIPTWPLGISVALGRLGGIASVTSWQTAVYATVAYSSISVALFLFLYRDPPRPAPDPGATRPPLWAISNRELALVLGSALMWMFINTGFIVFMSFTPTLLMGRGLSGMALVPPLAGYLLDLTRNASAPIYLSAALWLMTLSVLPVFRILRQREVPAT